MTTIDIAPGTATVPVLEQLPPTSLLLNTNVRAEVTLDPLFVASIAEHGVLTPVVAHRDEIGQVVVDQGQRRTRAAVEAGLTAIPVYVLPHAPGDADRIVDQLTENEHRAALGNRDLVAAVDQLALIGWTPAQIAKKVSIPKGVAAAAAKVAGSKVAVEHVTAMTLDDAALLVEFQDDEAAVVQITHEAERGGSVKAVVERIRSDYAERNAIAELRAELEGQGVTVIDPPDYDDKTTLPIARIETKDHKRITAAKHAETCPGHVVWIRTGWGARNTRQPEQHAGCRDWKKHGHTDSWASSGGSSRTAAADMTDDERDAARAERKHVIESNKDWRAATTVRRAWLREFAARKAAPTGAEQLIAHAISDGWSNVEAYQRTGMWELIGTKPGQVAGELQNAQRGRALQISLAICLASWESQLTDDAWRSQGTSQQRASLVLQAIAQWGHQLSAIEERVVDDTAREVQP